MDTAAHGATRAPSIVYLPASGPGGAGEYFRCLTLARAVARHWPEARAHFMLNRHASYAHEVPFPVQLLDSTPTHATAAVNALLERERPDIVVFDNAGRASQLRTAQQCGAVTIFISSRPNARRKGLRLQRVRHIDQHWVVQPDWATNPATSWERFKKRYFSHMRTLHLDTLFEESEPSERAALMQRLNPSGADYLVFCVGGGGRFGSGPSITQIAQAAAGIVAARSAMRCLIVLGPNFVAPSQSLQGVVSIGQLPNAQLMDLLRDARLVVSGGGALLLQVLVLGKVCVGVAVAGDQARRLQRCQERGLIEVAQANAASISDTVLRLLAEPNRCRSLREHLEAMHLHNGLGGALQAIEAIMRTRASPAARCEP